MQKWQKDFEKLKIATEAYLKANVEEMLYQPIPKLSMEKFALFQTTGNRLLYEQEYFAKRKFLTIFGVAIQRLELFEEALRHDICRKLEAILLSVCEEDTWALPAHVNPADVNWKYTIDLFAAETAQTLADLVDTVGYELSETCCTLVMEEVDKRVLAPFFKSEPGAYGWEACENNWNAVCNGCVGSAYLHSLSKGEAPKEQYLQRICDNLLHYIDGFAEDGTCPEGLGYYFYGMTYFVNFAQELFVATQGQTDLLYGLWGDFVAYDSQKRPISADVEKVDKRIQIAKWWCKCYFDNGFTVSFSDGSSKEKYRIGLARALELQFGAMKTPSENQVAMPDEDECHRYLPFKLDVLALREYQNNLLQKSQDSPATCLSNHNRADSITYILPAAQWCIAQTQSIKGCEEAQIIGFACKGGHNGESHNHNDVGSFLYVAGEDIFLTDLGAGEYTKKYFGMGRYNILCNRSMGHNLPLINGQEQLTGAEYRCRGFSAEEDEKSVKVAMYLEDTYAKKVLKKFLRTVIFQKEDGTCILTDEFESNGEMSVTENLVTQIKPQCKGTEVWLQGKNTVCKIKIKPAQVPEIITMEHSNHQGIKEQVYLIQWKINVKTKMQTEIHISV